MRRWTTIFATVILLGATPLPCPAQGGGERSVSLVLLFDKADVVVLGTIGKSVDSGQPSPASLLHVTEVLCDHPARVGQTKLPLELDIYAYGPNDLFLVLFTAKDGNLRFLASEKVTSQAMVSFAAGYLQARKKDRGEQMRFFFNYLDSADEIVYTEAYRELRNDRGDMLWAKQLPALTIAQWMKDPKTPSNRLIYLATLLAHCGDPKTHGDLVRSLLDDAQRNLDSPRLVASYVKLQPAEGWVYLQKTLECAKPADVSRRDSALIVLFWAWNDPHIGLNRQQILQGTGMGLDDPQTAGHAIFRLTQMKAWDLTDRVLDLAGKTTHADLGIQEAIVKYALANPMPRAAAFVEETRRIQPALFKRIELPANLGAVVENIK
ncbi:MAG TPA: hypothetical protein VE988_15240 [Gemmataceae bacterium]|nr:hypothetical protein [Gemmataceae bacterium]